MAYNPRPVPQLKGDAADLAQWLGEELQTISRSEQESEQVQFTVLSVAPKRPRAGMVVVADGVHWNPGAGAGLYLFQNGVWARL
jgi:hypothetical protein